MKKLLLSLVMLLAIGLTTVIAGDETVVSEQTKKNFEKEFPGAKSVQWNNAGDYQVVTFTYENYGVEAYFDTQTEELVGAARYIMFDQLPLLVMRAFNKNFGDTGFLNVLEISNTAGVSYLFTAEKQNKRYRFKISSDGNLLSKIKIKQ